MSNSRLVIMAVVGVGAFSSANADLIFVDDDNCPGPGSGMEGDPYCSIQDAIEAVLDTDEIVVAPGSYFETIDFLGKAITLRSSDGPEVTIIHGQQMGSVVTCESGEGSDTVLEGFWISGGSGAQTLCGSSPCTAGGGMFNDGSSPTVTNCIFIGNSAGRRGGGMYNAHGTHPTVRDCTFMGNSAERGGGLYNGGNSTVTNCTFIGNYANVRGGGLYNSDSSFGGVFDCTFDGNSTGGYGGGMYNQNSDNTTTVANCTFTGNSADTGGGGMWNAHSSPTVTNCTFSGNTGGMYGGGMYNAGSPTVINCAFSENSAPLGGGVFNFQSSPSMYGCMFEGNTAAACGGGMYNLITETYCAGPLPCDHQRLVNCMFDGNVADQGGGMYNDDSHPTVTGCVFRGNSADGSGGGMQNAASSPTVVNCTYSGNSAEVGAGMFNTISNPTVTNCTFSGNSADSVGGGMWNTFASPTVTNCTFSVNSAGNNGGGMYNSFDSTPTVTNCILWGCSPNEISGIGTPTVSYSSVQGGSPGTGNIDADPLFIDPDNGDYRLSAASPCIDAGNNWGVAPDFADVDTDDDTLELTPLDLDGNPRFAGDGNDMDPGCGIPVVVDMGAYEYQGDPTPDPIYFADLNGDGFVGVADLMILNGCVGSSDPDCCIADLDLDGEVRMSDRILMWGELIEFSPVR